MPPPDTSNLLDPIAISRAESLGLNARFIVEGYMAGEHKSPYRGFAIEFAQHREVEPGGGGPPRLAQPAWERCCVRS